MITIRPYETGDEVAQAAIYNADASRLPKFKPATADEIARRGYSPGSRLFAVEGGKVVGYSTFNDNGRVGYPWSLPGSEEAREALWRGLMRLIESAPDDVVPWTTYRADWTPILDDFRRRGFVQSRVAINLVAPARRLVGDGESPRSPMISPMRREDVAELLERGKDVIEEKDIGPLTSFLLDNRYVSPESLFVIRDASGALQAAGIAVLDDSYADPTKIDSAMPCFRLGAFGAERQRHKRVNGLISWIATDADWERLAVSEAASRLLGAGVETAAAQIFSSEGSTAVRIPEGFERQASFPILRFARTRQPGS